MTSHLNMLALRVRAFRLVPQGHHGERGISLPLGGELPENDSGAKRSGGGVGEEGGLQRCRLQRHAGLPQDQGCHGAQESQ